MKTAFQKRMVAIGIIIVSYLIWQIIQMTYNYYPITNYPPANSKVAFFTISPFDVQNSDHANEYAHILGKRLGVSIAVEQASSSNLADLNMLIASKPLAPDVGIVMIELPRQILQSVKNSASGRMQLTDAIRVAQKQNAVVLLLGSSNTSGDDDIAKSIARETGSLVVPNILLLITANGLASTSIATRNDKIADAIAPTLESLLVSE